MQSVDQDQLGGNHRRPLEEYSLPTRESQILHLQHGRVDVVRRLGQQAFEVGKEGRIVERPFRGFLFADLLVDDGDEEPWRRAPRSTSAGWAGNE